MNNMGMNEAEMSAGMGDVAEALIKSAPVLKKYGMDGEKMGEELIADRKACERADAEQEEAKRIAIRKTEVKDALYSRGWVKASGYLDIVIAAVGKDTPEAKNFRQIRSRLQRPPPDEAPTPLPVPDPGRMQ